MSTFDHVVFDNNVFDSIFVRIKKKINLFINTIKLNLKGKQPQIINLDIKSNYKKVE